MQVVILIELNGDFLTRYDVYRAIRSQFDPYAERQDTIQSGEQGCFTDESGRVIGGWQVGESPKLDMTSRALGFGPSRSPIVSSVVTPQTMK